MPFESVTAITLLSDAADGGEIRQGRFVTVTGAAAGTVSEVDATGDVIVGVALESVAAADMGNTLSVAIFGKVECEAGDAIVAGTVIATDADGQASDTVAVGAEIVGVAMEAAGAAGEFFTVLLRAAPVLGT